MVFFLFESTVIRVPVDELRNGFDGSFFNFLETVLVLGGVLVLICWVTSSQNSKKKLILTLD